MTKPTKEELVDLLSRIQNARERLAEDQHHWLDGWLAQIGMPGPFGFKLMPDGRKLPDWTPEELTALGEALQAAGAVLLAAVEASTPLDAAALRRLN